MPGWVQFDRPQRSLVLTALELCAQMRCVGVLHAHGCRVHHACACEAALISSVLQAASSSINTHAARELSRGLSRGLRGRLGRRLAGRLDVGSTRP